MSIKEQLHKIKENWLLALFILLVLIFLNSNGLIIPSSFDSGSYFAEKTAVSESAPFRGGYGIVPSPQDFAPDVKDRKITKTSSMTIEVEQGRFKDAESKLKSAISSTGSYLLNENVNKYDSGWKSYYNGYYTIKVDTKKYDSVVLKLKDIGEVKSFNENAEDITGSYKDAEIELDAEKERLKRYEQMYQEAKEVSDKIQLSDKIFEQERIIKYLEDSLKNMDKQVEYSTIIVSLNEKQSEYAGIAFIKFSELAGILVSSINSLFGFIFIALPYGIAALVAWVILKLVRKKIKPTRKKL